LSHARTYVFAGGGTGGHLFPGLSVAEELLARRPDARIVFAGSNRAIETQAHVGRGFERVLLPCESVRTLRRRPWRFVWNNLRGWRAATRWIDQNSPDVVIGLGGFASAPLVYSAARRGIPVVLLEQNVVCGRATRWLSRRAALVCVSFSETMNELRRGTHAAVTGNPVRREVAALLSARGSHATGGPRTLLVLGGSQGAQPVNVAMLETAAAIRASLAGWRIVHQTGAEQIELVRQRYRELRLTAVVEPFFADLPAWYPTAEIAIARAGATTLAELACAGLPSLLVPYPHAARDHQRHNAQVFAAAGAARIIEQRSDPAHTSADLGRNLLDLIDSAGIRHRMRRAMRALARPDAARAVVDQVERLIGGRDHRINPAPVRSAA
jgi:UDP-N-acetylglucosamine--N-acetylmuramyl-(pentapeptide) pyrophosphoryl-undecaprenol N-acetylglucosamine transferase